MATPNAGPPPMNKAMQEYFQAMTRLNTHWQDRHPMMAEETHDERARQSFVKSLHMRSANLSRMEAKMVYEGRVAPRFAQKNGGKRPATRSEARLALEEDIFWQTVVGLRRTSQEMLWASVIDTVERTAPEINARARTVDRQLGSLKVNPALPIPGYLSGVDIHAMPGNYHTEYAPDDVSAGALFDRGTYLYTHGYVGSQGDNLGKGVVEYIRNTWPDFKPKRILDMGCSTGSSTLPYCDAFPDAEIHAIDLGAPCVRYGYARANGLGKAVHFSQQNAEHTDFPDEHFDLVVSHIMLHETSRQAIPRIFEESRRLLRQGGKMVHADLPNISKIPDLFQQVSVNQDHHDNNEPMWGGYWDLDLPKLIEGAGFDAGTIRVDSAPMLITVPPSSADPATDRIVRGMFGYGILAASR
jgi:SAM-dependent methyltransferase